MKPFLLTAFFVTIGLTVGNFVFQFLASEPNWMVALDRSFFQFLAIMVFMWLVDRKMRQMRSE